MLETYLEDIERRSAQLPGQRLDWLRHLRGEGLAQFKAQGFPTRAREAWKYTDVRAIEKLHFAPVPAAADVDPARLQPYLLADQPTHRLVFVDGHFSAALSDLGALPQGVTVTNLAAALAQDDGTLQAHLGQGAPLDRPGFNALNTALMSDGVYIRLARGTVLEAPIQVLFVASGTHEAGAAHLRNLLVAEEGSKAVLIETYAGLGEGAYLTNAVTEIALGAEAAVEHYKLEQEGEQGYHIASTQVQQARGSRYVSHSIALGGLLVRNELRTVLDGEGSACDLNGLYLAQGRQHIDNHTLIDHAKPGCSSREYYKGVLDGASRGVFSGRVVVHPDAQQTDAQQANHNLLLSEDAEADSRPQLEIYADDVKCSHGSTVGQLDQAALFYLRSRAISEARARDLLIYAFASDVLERMQLPALRARLEAQLTGRLLHGEHIEAAA